MNAIKTPSLMKKFYFFLVALFMVNGAMAQSCLPDGITFTTQAQIDSFQINYPGCTEIEGDVKIGGSNINDLNGLNVVTTIGGSLYVGIPFSAWGGTPTVIGNPLLTNLTGLNSLTYIGGSLIIWGDNQLTNLSGLDSLTYIGWNLSIGEYLFGWGSWYGNPVLTSLTGLNSLTTIYSGVSIVGNDSLTNLVGLDGLASIHSLSIAYNPALNNLTGLDNIDADSLSYLYIYNNDLLSMCEVQSICDYLANPNGTIEIHDNATGCNSQQEVEEACASVGGELLIQESPLTVYPNPASTDIIIETIAKGHLFVMNLRGQQLLQQTIMKPLTQIDISNLPSGFYVVRLVGERGVQVFKVIKD